MSTHQELAVSVIQIMMNKKKNHKVNISGLKDKKRHIKKAPKK